MSDPRFVHLRLHSEYSIADGIVRLDDGIAAYYRRHDSNVTLNTEEVQREFMLASLKWAVRNRMKKGGAISPIFAELFLRRGDAGEEPGR